MHLYCLFPPRAEVTEAWYCDGCGKARSDVAARSQAEARARHAKRAAAAAARQQAKRQKREQAKQLRKQQRREERRQEERLEQQQQQQESQQRQEGQQDQQQQGRQEQEKQQQQQQQPAPRPQQPPPPRAVASRDTLSLLFDSLSRDDSEQQTRIGRMVDGTSSRMRATSEQQRLLREQHTLARARQKGMLWSGRLQLPNECSPGMPGARLLMRFMYTTLCDANCIPLPSVCPFRCAAGRQL